jgi:hypothetical protein
LPFRLVAGVWTLAAFIFVQAYTSTLFTYVVAPVNHPLIDSLYDIADNPEIHLLVKNEGTPDRYFTVRFEYVFSLIIEKAVFFITNREITGLDFMRNCETGSTTFPNPAAHWCPSVSI